jgi:hypothetical protein
MHSLTAGNKNKQGCAWISADSVISPHDLTMKFYYIVIINPTHEYYYTLTPISPSREMPNVGMV